MKLNYSYFYIFLLVSYMPNILSAAELDELSSELSTLNTGSSNSLLGSSTSSLTDLIPDFKLGIDPSDVSDDGKLRKMSLTYSPRISKFADIGLTIKLEDGNVLEAFGDSGLITNEEENKLNKLVSLSDSQEYTVDFSLIGNFLGQQFGRSIGLYQSELDRFLDIGLGSMLSERRNQLRDDRAELFRQLRDLGTCPNHIAVFENSGRANSVELLLNDISSISSAEIDCTTLANDLAPIDIEYREVTSASVARLEDSLTKIGLLQAVSLIDQQPQFLVSFRHHDKDDLVGPDESAIKLTWEMGLGQGSLNDLTSSREWRNCINGGPFCVSRIGARINELVTRNVQQTTWRLSFNAEWIDRSDHRFSNDDPMFEYDVIGESSIKAGATFSAKTWLDSSGEPYVFDMAAEYENNDSEIMNDRAVMTFTGTRNLAKGLGLSLSLVWANRPEFRGEVDEDIGVKLGLNWKLSTN
ncbi:MAG: hypothetical protein DHS20C09_05580 [marine bacterium B5-7]|nr:MAG: hypothetical protein DHS20C09_05580 [marine bacterium B5-7]